MPTNETTYKCKKCGEEIPGNTNKNLATCKCGALAVDGCEDYVRVIGDKEDWAQWEAAGAADVAKHLPPLTDVETAHYKNLKD